MMTVLNSLPMRRASGLAIEEFLLLREGLEGLEMLFAAYPKASSDEVREVIARYLRYALGEIGGPALDVNDDDAFIVAASRWFAAHKTRMEIKTDKRPDLPFEARHAWLKLKKPAKANK